MAKKTSWVVGFHAIEAVLRLSPERAILLLVQSNRDKHNQNSVVMLAESLKLSVSYVDKSNLNQQCGLDQNQGIALQVATKKENKETELVGYVESLSHPLLLILDQVQDPHNFGACLRTADAAGVNAVIVTKDNAAPMTAVVQKVACGAAETVPVYRVTNLARTMDKLKQLGIWMIGTSDKADHSLYQQELNGNIALVMGTEGKGLRALTEKKCDALVNLPMAGDIVTSLNVSVATGVCLYEILRQRAID